MIGDIGATWNSLWLSRFGQKYDIKQDSITSGESSVPFDKFKDMPL